ncbi:MAG: ATP-dependent Clp protease adapter ClpS [Cocleimonas sp.]
MVESLNQRKHIYRIGKVINSVTKVVNNQSGDEFDQDSGLMVQESRPEVAEPKRYMVILVNDDFTPMEFVVEILRQFFSHDEESATRIMLNVHTKGKGVCGIFSKDIAETKVVLVNEFAQENEHPLLCTMEKA